MKKTVARRKSRVVDHDIRRSEVAEVVAELIASEGSEAVTVRGVAEAAGFSTAVVSHYFANKKHLLLVTYRAAAERAAQRVEQVERAGGVDVQRHLEALLPLDEDSRRDWLVWCSFWGMAIADPELSAEHLYQVQAARAKLAAKLRQTAEAKGQADENADYAEQAAHLFALLIGVAVEAAFEPENWPHERQRRAIAQALAHGAPSKI